jgi:hypothetical protein
VGDYGSRFIYTMPDRKTGVSTLYFLVLDTVTDAVIKITVFHLLETFLSTVFTTSFLNVRP